MSTNNQNVFNNSMPNCGNYNSNENSSNFFAGNEFNGYNGSVGYNVHHQNVTSNELTNSYPMYYRHPLYMQTYQPLPTQSIQEIQAMQTFPLPLYNSRPLLYYPPIVPGIGYASCPFPNQTQFQTQTVNNYYKAHESACELSDSDGDETTETIPNNDIEDNEGNTINKGNVGNIINESYLNNNDQYRPCIQYEIHNKIDINGNNTLQHKKCCIMM